MVKIQALALYRQFFLEEIGPSIYNQAVADVQQRMQMHVADLDIEFHEEEFQHWPQSDRKRREG